MSLRLMRPPEPAQQHGDMDPLAGMANLFDASIVLIVSMMVALLMSFNLLGLMDSTSEVTITRQGAEGEVEILTKQGSEIRVQRVTQSELSGMGVRLGTAFQLEDGRVVYVPD